MLDRELNERMLVRLGKTVGGPRLMPLYMTQFGYTVRRGWTGQESENRAEGFSTLAKKMGGRLVDLYYCFGEYDGVVLFEAPDDASQRR